MSKPRNPLSPIRVPDEGQLGPAMQALSSERMRAFVIALVDQGGRNQTRAYLAAGYNAKGDAARVSACQLAHDERIIAAIREESKHRLGAASLAATSFLVNILDDENPDPGIKVGHKMKAAAMIMNRVGLHETAETISTVRKEESEGEKIERAVRMAKELGLDPAVLLGNIGIELPSKETPLPAGVTEAEAELVGSTEGLEDLLK